MDIPLKNRKKEVVAYTKISKEDIEKVTKYNWYRHSPNSERIYVVGTVDGKRISLHHFIIGKPERGYVVDHINNDTLDNRRENLRIVSISKNNQNNRKKANCSSKYIGVYFSKNNQKWVTNHSSKRIGGFSSEEEAAKAYDKFVINKYGNDAKTNFDIKSYGKILSTNENTRNRGLPRYVSYQKDKKKHRSRINFNGKEYLCGYFLCPQKAHEEALKKKKELENQLMREHKLKPITYDDDKVPIIRASNKDQMFIIKVDEDNWHDLTQYIWRVRKDGYAQSRVNSKMSLMHRYILKNEDINKKCIDHINGDKLDNRKVNLQIVKHTFNNHNKTKRQGCSSRYKGVSKRNKSQWKMQINHEGNYFISMHESEIEAAKAYNKKALELYGEKANINMFD